MSDLHEIEGLTPARLRAVAAVAETGSFSAAANKVGTSQSNVSRSVAAVEAVLNRPIFERSTRSVRLTDAGREFIERVAVINAELEAAVRATREPEQKPAPRLTIAALSSVSELHLPAALSRLEGRVPRFRCIEGLQSTVEQAVLSGQATAGVGDLADVSSDLRTQPLWNEPFRVAVSRGHRLGSRRKVRLADVASEPLVGFSREAELRSTLDRQLASARQLRAPDYIVDRYRTALSLVAAGLGVMVVPSIAEAATPPGTKLVDLDHPDLHRTMGVIHLPNVIRPDPLDALIGQLVEAVSGVRGVVALDA